LLALLAIIVLVSLADWRRDRRWAALIGGSIAADSKL